MKCKQYLLILIFIVSMLLGGCKVDFDGNVYNTRSSFDIDFFTLNKTKKGNLYISTGETISVEIELEQGNVALDIRREDCKPIYRGNGLQNERFSVVASIGGRYIVYVDGNNARGRVSFNVTN